MSLAGGPSFREPFRLLEAWLTGIRYARNQANGHSVITAAAGLFHLPGLNVGDDNTPPFEAIKSMLLARLPRTPVILSPTGDLSSQVNRRLTALAEQVWFEIGSNLAPPEVPTGGNGGGGISLETAQTLMKPWAKDKEFRYKDKTIARTRILCAAKPAAGPRRHTS